MRKPSCMRNSFRDQLRCSGEQRVALSGTRSLLMAIRPFMPWKLSFRSAKHSNCHFSCLISWKLFINWKMELKKTSVFWARARHWEERIISNYNWIIPWVARFYRHSTAFLHRAGPGWVGPRGFEFLLKHNPKKGGETNFTETPNNHPRPRPTGMPFRRESCVLRHQSWVSA